MKSDGDVFIQGRGLASALGLTLGEALPALARGGVDPRPLAPAPGSQWPHFGIPDETPDWNARARRLVRSAVAECGDDLDRDAPLFIASSSLDVGAIEEEADTPPDCQAFAEWIAAWLEWRGPVYWVSTACTSALNALLSARRLLRAGAADHALVLGLELRNRFSSAGFGAMQLLDPVSPRPLARDRGGLVLGEAVAALYLGRQPARWRLRGGANRVDGGNPAGASREAMARVAADALAESGIAPGQVDLVKLQAAGSPHNDAEEILGLRQVFSPLPPLTTLKTCLGHTLGASGAAEIALLTACLEAGIQPAGISGEPDPALPPLSPLPARPRIILATILGFGGGHAGVVLEDMQADTPGARP